MRLRSRKTTEARRGLSLLEVLAALAIFFFTAVVLTQMVQTGSEAAQRARRLTKAQLLAETKMSELTAGALPMSSGGGVITDEPEGWSYEASITPESWSNVTDSSGASVTGLYSVVVTVRWETGASAPVEFSLSRMILAPSLRIPSQTGGQ